MEYKTSLNVGKDRYSPQTLLNPSPSTLSPASEGVAIHELEQLERVIGEVDQV